MPGSHPVPRRMAGHGEAQPIFPRRCGSSDGGRLGGCDHDDLLDPTNWMRLAVNGHGYVLECSPRRGCRPVSALLAEGRDAEANGPVIRVLLPLVDVECRQHMTLDSSHPTYLSRYVCVQKGLRACVCVRACTESQRLNAIGAYLPSTHKVPQRPPWRATAMAHVTTRLTLTSSPDALPT